MSASTTTRLERVQQKLLKEVKEVYDACMKQLYDKYKPLFHAADDPVYYWRLKDEFKSIGDRMIHEYSSIVENIIHLTPEDLEPPQNLNSLPIKKEKK